MKSDCAKSMSIRAKINNFAKAKGILPQHALQSFFAERFLARIGIVKSRLPRGERYFQP